MREIAEIVGAEFPDCRVTFAAGSGPDTRSYRVSFDKINELLPGFACEWDAGSAPLSSGEVFERIALTRRAISSGADSRG